MKAIIMAGGEGTRLRPVSLNRPKPMTELFDRPVLEHILKLLRINGVTEACLTLKYLPRMITDWFGGGEAYGVRLDYRVEEEALGTAGGVLNCADFVGGEDFLVLSGDCVCDFDLKTLIDYHSEKRAEVTLALYSHKTPLEYGLVVTDGEGRIERFLEKPDWDHVLTDRINTGVYILSPSVLSAIPKNRPYDFGRELFPRFLEEKRAMFGLAMPGYWCDIGTVGAYLQCAMDILDGKAGLILDAPSPREGVWSVPPLPDGAELVPPVYIGRGARR
jgi:mannose-1-phosphate guanylyltransferase/phosphomannomutase